MTLVSKCRKSRYCCSLVTTSGNCMIRLSCTSELTRRQVSTALLEQTKEQTSHVNVCRCLVAELVNSRHVEYEPQHSAPAIHNRTAKSSRLFTIELLKNAFIINDYGVIPSTKKFRYNRTQRPLLPFHILRCTPKHTNELA